MTSTCIAVFGYTPLGAEVFAGVIPSGSRHLERLQQEIYSNYGRIPYGFEGDVPWHRATEEGESVHVVVSRDPGDPVAIAAYDRLQDARRSVREQAEIGREARIVTTTMGHLDEGAFKVT